MKILARIGLRWLGRTVYGSLVPFPAEHLTGAENYLVDLWRIAPKKIALVHTLLAILMYLSPPLILLTPHFLAGLTPRQNNEFQARLIRSRFFLLRTITYGVRGHALVAILREPSARAWLLKKEQPLKISA
jgi:hypothetical protein